MNIKIIHEDEYIVVIEKPHNMPSQGDLSLDDSVLDYLEYYYEEKNIKNPEIYLLHRLDRPVGGVMVLAKTKEANKEISRQIQNRSFKKEYLCVVSGKPQCKENKIENYLTKNSKTNMSSVCDKNSKNAKLAVLDYKVIKSVETDEHGILSLLNIKLHTGRHHQIRVQLSNAELPIWGDNKYNPAFNKSRTSSQIALWSHKLKFNHPKTKNEVCFTATPEESFPWSIFN
jgi:23S rRNA pseudouridine1911/1915/1917 synthase